MSEELRLCPFCGEMPVSNDFGTKCTNGKCESFVSTSHNVWNTRPIEDTLRAELAACKASREWISVKDRLPIEGQQVIIFDGDEVSIATWQDGWWWETPEFTADDVTHWQPLPAAPKQES